MNNCQIEDAPRLDEAGPSQPITQGDILAHNIAIGALRQELASARTTLGLALSHLETSYAVSGTLHGVTPAQRMAISCAHRNIRDALAHLNMDDRQVLDCGGESSKTPLSDDHTAIEEPTSIH